MYTCVRPAVSLKDTFYVPQPRELSRHFKTAGALAHIHQETLLCQFRKGNWCDSLHKARACFKTTCGANCLQDGGDENTKKKDTYHTLCSLKMNNEKLQHFAQNHTV